MRAMIVTDRLKACLVGQGISQAELARRVGLQQSTINLLINGKSRTTTKLREIARELKTTPAFLLGETDDPDSEASDFALSFQEQVIVQGLRLLAHADFELVNQLIERLQQPRAVYRARDAQPEATIHDRKQDYRGQPELKPWGK